MEAIFGVIFGLLGISALFGLYFLPAIVANSRGHRNFGSVLVINLFFGWTFIGWVVALAIAASGNVQTPDVQVPDWMNAA